MICELLGAEKRGREPFYVSDVYGVTLFRTLIEKGYTREVAGGYVDQLL
jgi:hypothetical protein